MAENVLVRPAGQIEPGADGEEIEASLRHFRPSFAGQTFNQDRVHRVEIADIGGGIILLRVGQAGCAPVARLLHFRQLFAEQLADQLLQSVPIGIGAGQLAGDLGAKHRSGGDAQIMFDRGQIEPGKVKQLEPCRIGQNGFQMGRIERAAGREADEVFIPATIGNLDQTQPVSRGYQPHRLGIDRNRARTERAFGEIFFVEMDSHMGQMLRLIGRQGKVLRLEFDGVIHHEAVPASWRDALEPVLASPEARRLGGFLKTEEAAGKRIYPPPGSRLRALELTPRDAVKVVILGQDPYHGPGQAHGLSFSVQDGVRVPPSLLNIYKEIEADLGLPRPSHGNLSSWARRGVLLLNAVLTVEDGQPASHQGEGWEAISDAVVAAVAAKPEPCVFLLWGSHARKQAGHVPGLANSHHLVLTAPHPSPLSAHAGFLGCRHFSQANAFLEAKGRGAVDWRL